MRWNPCRAVFLVTLLVSAGCGREERGSPPIVVQATLDIEGIDPHASGQRWQTQSVLSNIYEGLVGFDQQMAVYPALALSWSNRDDYTWDFQLRSGVRFHCGGVLTASDVVFSFERARTHPNSVLRAVLSTLESVEEMPGNRVRIRTRQPDGALISRLAFVFVMSKAFSSRSSDPIHDTEACGTGPYALEKWEKGQFVKLKAYKDYWKGPARIQEGWVVAGPMQSSDQLKSLPAEYGLVFWARPGTPNYASAVRERKPVTAPSLSVTYLGFDLRSSASPSVKTKGRGGANPFLDPKVREALAASIDYENLNQSLGAAGGGIASQMVPALVFGFDPSILPTRFDVSKARSLLAETPFKDGFDVEFDVREVMADYAEPIAHSMRSLGLRVTVNLLEDKAFFDKLAAGKSSLYLLRFSCRSGDAQEFFDKWVHSKNPEQGLGSANYSFDQNPVEGLDARIDEARRELDMATRQRQLQEIMQRVVRGRLAIPVFNEQEFLFRPPGLQWPPRADTFKLFYEAEFKALE